MRSEGEYEGEAPLPKAGTCSTVALTCGVIGGSPLIGAENWSRAKWDQESSAVSSAYGYRILGLAAAGPEDKQAED
jgi:hypothetical protein